MNDDADLRERFQALRREDAGRSRSFDRVLRTTARVVPRPTAWLASAAGVVLAVAAVWVWRLESQERTVRPSRDAPSLADWRSPTDFLLDTSASALLREVPRIGDPRTNPPAPARRPTEEHPT
jgi:hypothetical protein